MGQEKRTPKIDPFDPRDQAPERTEDYVPPEDDPKARRDPGTEREVVRGYTHKRRLPRRRINPPTDSELKIDDKYNF